MDQLTQPSPTRSNSEDEDSQFQRDLSEAKNLSLSLAGAAGDVEEFGDGQSGATPGASSVSSKDPMKKPAMMARKRKSTRFSQMVVLPRRGDASLKPAISSSFALRSQILSSACSLSAPPPPPPY